jgi:hypothetical protein
MYGPVGRNVGEFLLLTQSEPISHRDVVGDGVAGDVLQRELRWHAPTAAPDDDRELQLPVVLLALRRKDDVVTRTTERRDRAQEQVRLAARGTRAHDARDLLAHLLVSHPGLGADALCDAQLDDVLEVVGSGLKDLPRHHGREQPEAVERAHVAAARLSDPSDPRPRGVPVLEELQRGRNAMR